MPVTGLEMASYQAGRLTIAGGHGTHEWRATNARSVVTTGFGTRTRGAQREPAAPRNRRRLLLKPPARLRRAGG